MTLQLMLPTMTVRPTNEEDWEALKTIRLASLLDTPTAFGVSHATVAANTDAQWQDWASARRGPQFFLAFDEGEAVGLAGGGVDASGRFNLIAMWVRPEYRGAHIASRLVDAVKAHAAAKGHARIILSVSPNNARAASFYRKQGFIFIPEWEALASHPEIEVQTMEWLAPGTAQACPTPG